MFNKDPKIIAAYVITGALVVAGLLTLGSAAIALYFPGMLPFAIPEIFYAGQAAFTTIVATLAVSFVVLSVASLLFTLLYDQHAEFNKRAKVHNARLDREFEARHSHSTANMFSNMHHKQYQTDNDLYPEEDYMFVSSFSFLLFVAAYPLLSRVCPTRFLFFIMPEMGVDYSSDEESGCDFEPNTPRFY